MHLGDPKRRVLAVVLATICGCTCHGKGQVGTGAAEAHDEPPPQQQQPADRESARAQLRVADPPPKPETEGRFDVERVGWVKAKLGDRTLDLPVLPKTQNRVALDGKPPLVIVDGYASEAGGEHLRVHMQGVPFERSKGRTLLPIPDNRSWLVAITYQDAQGKTWVGKVGRTPGVEVRLDEVDMGTQLVSGTFSGQLRETDGEALLDLRDGSFRTIQAEGSPPPG